MFAFGEIDACASKLQRIEQRDQQLAPEAVVDGAALALATRSGTGGARSALATAVAGVFRSQHRRPKRIQVGG